MTPSDEFSKLLDMALVEATELTAKTVKEHALDQLAGWSLDEKAGRLLFADAKQRYAMMAAQVVGLYDPNTRQWRWAWSDASFPVPLLQAAHRARSWGATNNVSWLTEPTITIDEAMAWKLAAFTARLVNWPGIYRGDGGPSVIYLAFAPTIEPLSGPEVISRFNLLPPPRKPS
jgi:hypothetical protein